MKKSLLSFLTALCLASFASLPHVSATVPYSPTAEPANEAAERSATSELSGQATARKMPVISDIVMFQYQQPAGEYTVQVVVDDPTVSCSWESDGILSDIPYPGDASFIEHPNLFKAVEFTTTGTHYVSVTASNASGHDYYTKTFYITSVKTDR